jgi:hypothetical protein
MANSSLSVAIRQKVVRQSTKPAPCVRGVSSQVMAFQLWKITKSDRLY